MIYEEAESIPLLSGKKFSDFTPDEFKAHVISLYFKREKKKSKSAGALKEFTCRVNKKGTLCLRVNRKPKWIAHDEIEAMSKEHGIESLTIYKKLEKSKIEIRDRNKLEFTV